LNARKRGAACRHHANRLLLTAVDSTWPRRQSMCRRGLVRIVPAGPNGERTLLSAVVRLRAETGHPMQRLCPNPCPLGFSDYDYEWVQVLFYAAFRSSRAWQNSHIFAFEVI